MASSALAVRITNPAVDIAAVAAAIEQLDAVPEYPGNYIFAQYVQFAFMDAYNLGMNPADAMLGNVTYINKEISRKRKEFGLGYKEITYGADAEDVESSAAED